MDMKMGLALHMHLIENAAAEDWPINLLLMTVPDEEVDSAGMRAAVEIMPSALFYGVETHVGEPKKSAAKQHRPVRQGSAQAHRTAPYDKIIFSHLSRL